MQLLRLFQEMEIKFFKTNAIDDAMFISYTKAFNFVFERNISPNFFKKKYSSSSKGYSYHVFMLENNAVVGACTAIPYNFTVNGKRVLLSIIGGLFIHPDYRRDSLAFLKMYKLLKDNMLLDGISGVYAIPNENAYLYWKKIVKFTDIGRLHYYVLPLKVGNILKKFKIVNTLSYTVCWSFVKCMNLFSKLLYSEDTGSKITLVRNGEFEKHRYDNIHVVVKKNDITFTYTISNEEGVKTAFLLDYYNLNGNRDSNVLSVAINSIMENETIDLIVYIGFINHSYSSLLKVPLSKEPRPLYLNGDLFNPDISNNLFFNSKNWDFSLSYFDVR